MIKNHSIKVQKFQKFYYTTSDSKVKMGYLPFYLIKYDRLLKKFELPFID
jgi:hypothetical protein